VKDNGSCSISDASFSSSEEHIYKYDRDSSKNHEGFALFIGLHCLNIGSPRLGSISLLLLQIQQVVQLNKLAKR
jgi:hypothetical protein